MTITALPTPPSRADSPDDFSGKADALLGALPGFVTEANALQSDVNAKEASASSHATIATNKAAEAQGHATTAITKASEAAASAVAAAAAASNAEIAFDSFDDKYLGSKASDPTTDNDGNALLVGALYWNTTVGAVRVWNGSAWLSMAADASIVDFQQAGTGAVVRTAQDKMREWVSVKDFGAVGDGVTDDTAAFSAAASSAMQVVVPSGAYKLNTDPVYVGSICWIVHHGVSFSGPGAINYSNTSKIVSFGGFDSIESDASYHEGIFGYLESTSALSAYGNLGLHGSAKTNWRASPGGGGSADIAVSGFATNNLPGHLGAAWALYGTAVREVGAYSTHACELDIANMGSTVPLFPAMPFAAGQTNALWLASGGEITETANNPGTASVAIGIISNDPQSIANFDKGILFHNKAINGTNGESGAGIAIAFATGHEVSWFNNSSVLSGSFACTNRSGTNTQRVDLGQFGLVVENIGDGTTQFQVRNTPSAANRVSVKAAVSGAAPEISSFGGDVSIDLKLVTKGTGVIWFGAWASNADVPINGYVTIKDSNGNVRKLATIT